MRKESVPDFPMFHAKAQSNAMNSKDIVRFASLAPLHEISAFKMTGH